MSSYDDHRRDYAVRTTPAPTSNPVSCPTCRSNAIATTAKSPNAGSYWRCNSCGEVWNDSRTRAAQRSGPRWR